MHKKRFLILVAFLLVFTMAGVASATSVLLSEGRNYYAHYGDSSWTTMSATLDTATGNNVSVVYDFENMTQMLSYDALWLDQRYQGSLTANEVGNITSFIATGRKVVMIGENDNWNSWNRQIIEDINGGSYGGGYTSGNMNPTVINALTNGVSQVCLSSGGFVASGGTALFDYNFATLWGTNVLTVLDSNLFTNSHWSDADNAIFATNIANWIADSNSTAVPEPATMLLLGSGLIGLAGFRRKLRKG